MAYLSNRTVNYLNLHSALIAILEQVFSIYVPIFLYTQGFPLPEVFVLLMCLNIARLPLRLLTFPIVKQLGVRNGLIIGTIGYGLSFPLLSFVRPDNLALIAYVFVYGIFNSLYWYSYHTIYSIAGEAEKRGRQLAIAQVMGMLLSSAVPVLGALFVASHGYQKLFYFAIPLIFFMVAALLPCQNVIAGPGEMKWKEGKKLIFSLGAKIHLWEASAVWPLNFVWLFVMYFYVDKLVTFGAIVTFSIIFQVIYQLWLGSAVDSGKGKRIANLAGGLRLLQMVAKVFFPLSLYSVGAVGALSGATNVHHNLSQPTVMYNTGKNTNNPFWYWLFAESAYDCGVILGAGLVIILLHFGVPLRYTILVALPGIIMVWRLTLSYFKR